MKKQELTQEDIIKKVTSILGKIIKENSQSFSEDDFKVRPGYGYDQFYLNSVDGSYYMSLQGLIHYILFEEKIYAKILNKKQSASLLRVINNTPEAIYGPGEESDEDYEVQELLDEVYFKSIRFVGEKLLELGFDVKTTFSDYLETDDEPAHDEKNEIDSDLLADTSDGKSNKTISIGNQTWFSGNLNESFFRNGDPIPEAISDEEWAMAGNEEKPAWCYYGNKKNNGEKHGKLYNWYAVSDPRGLAPVGWHIADFYEWSDLIDNMGGNDLAASKLKSRSGWPGKENGNNSSGFSALPCGYRSSNSHFAEIESFGSFWTSMENDGNDAQSVGIRKNHIYISPADKRIGRAVRCLKDSDTKRILPDYWYSDPVPVHEPIISTPGTFEDLRNGKIYRTVTLGKQTWLAENLNSNSFRNGDLIPEARSDKEWVIAANEKTPAWCYYDNDPDNGRVYGKLYNWYAVNDKRGLAPKGWHIPADKEWAALGFYLGGEYVAGTKMRSKQGWIEKGNGTDQSGFTALPGGSRSFNQADSTLKNKAKSSNGIGKSGEWWSSTRYKGEWYSRIRDMVRIWYVVHNKREILRHNYYMADGLSVRCVKNSPFWKR